MKQFCQTSSNFEVDNIINEAILRDFLQEWKVECRAGGLVPMRLVIFPIHLSKVLRLPRKSEARLYEVLHLSRTIILANLKISCSKMQPLSGNQRPDLLTSLMNMSLVLRLPCKIHLYGSSSHVPRLPSFLEMLQTHSRFAHFSTSKSAPRTVCFVHVDLEMCFAPQRTLFHHLNFQQWSATVIFFCFAPRRCTIFHLSSGQMAPRPPL